jgi:beta-galactosidase
MILNGPNPKSDGLRINVGDLTGILLSDGRRFGSDNFFTGGEAKALNSTSITALFERRGAPKKVLSQGISAALNEGYREGKFCYQLPLENGDWTVKVTSFEPEEGRALPRRFSVVANGATTLSHFSPFVAAKGALIEVTRSFPVHVQQGQLTLEFVPETGPAVVSAIEVERHH